ncbi:hypothetical protein WAA39_004384 [Enterobacter mori]|jgi:hypothetical protein|uniref:hypothetical protein n=1 Tax=Enterobacter mori TaxID=539813 RepID=UPI0025C75250|nr:hypothetical protein [Enterobacter mori]EME8861050.1 hypothetical protein [Enterobacter mori]
MFEEIYDYIKIRNDKDDKFLTAIMQQYNNNARYSNYFIRCLLTPLFTYLRPNNKVQYIFFSNKYSDIILNLPKGSVCVIGGPKQINYCVKNKIPLISNMKYWEVLSKGFSNLLAPETLHIVHQKMLKEISGYITEETVFIIDNDSMPMQRAIINVMKDLNVKILLIQDGLFQSRTPANFIHGWKSDRILCYDEHQKRILTDKINKKVKIDVVGFYKAITYRKIPEESRRICFLGQPWFKYGTDYQERYLEIVRLINKKMDGDIIYFKPHPWELDAPYIGEIENIYIGSMDEVLNDFDCFISLTSTALYEATIAGKLSIQILDDKFECDDFQNYGYAYSIDVEGIEKGNLNNLLKYEPINEHKQHENYLQDYIDYFRLKKYTLD